jgi:thiamine transport system permease protein
MDRGLDQRGAAVTSLPPAAEPEPAARPGRRWPDGWSLALWLLPAVVFLALFYFYPLAEILQLSLARAEGNLLAAVGEVLASPIYRSILGFTFYQAGLSTLATLLVGLPGAYLFARFAFRGQNVLRALTAVPFVLPTLVVAAGFNALLGPRGWVNLGLMALFNLETPPVGFINTLGAIVLAHVFYNTTIVLRLVGDYWSRLDPKLTAAARALGASPVRAFREITWPLLAPAVTAAALLVFIFDFTSFGVILVLGGPRFATLETEVYRQTVFLFNLPVAAVLALLQMAITLALTLVYSSLAARVTVPVNLRSQASVRQPLSTWRARLGAGALAALLAALLLAPMLALALRSVVRLETDVARGQVGLVEPGFTLAYYQELALNRRSTLFFVPPAAAIGNSLATAGTVVVLALTLGLPTAWVLARPGRGARVADALLMLPLGTSAVTLGLGFIVALDTPPLDLRASPLMLPLAHTLVALPFVVRSLAPALRSIRPRLRQAAAVLGASPGRVWREVDLPLVGRAVLVAATFAFTISLGEFGATAILARPERPTVPIVIYRFLGLPGALNFGQAMALSTLLMVVCAVGILAIERFRAADVGEF